MESKKEIINRVASGLREMKHLSNEELLDEHEERYVGSGPYWETGAELLARLERGRKAIEAINSILEINKEYGGMPLIIQGIINKYQQEAADGN